MRTTVDKSMTRSRIGQKSRLRLRRPDMLHRDLERAKKLPNRNKLRAVTR